MKGFIVSLATISLQAQFHFGVKGEAGWSFQDDFTQLMGDYMGYELRKNTSVSVSQPISSSPTTAYLGLFVERHIEGSRWISEIGLQYASYKSQSKLDLYESRDLFQS